MLTYIALIRGINVGGKNKLPMKSLVELLLKYDIKNVQTYLQTGNVIFQALHSAELVAASNFAKLINEHFGFEAEVIILTKAEFELAIQNNPYQDSIGKSCHFYFCKESAKLDVIRIEKLRIASENYQLHGKVFYLHAPDGIGKSKFANSTEACLAVKATARNLNTVNKIANMLN